MQPLTQQVGPPRLIVDVADQRVLHRYPPTGHIGVIPGGIESLGDLPPVIDGDQGVPQLIVGRVQRQRQSHPEPFVGKFADRRDQPHRGHRHRPGRNAETLRWLGDDAPHRSQHSNVIGQRLPHAHEDHVGETIAEVVAQGRGTGAHLFEDLGGRQVAVQSALTGRTERASHTAAGLRRDAHRVALRIAHQHRLDGGAVGGPPQRLSRLAGITGDLGCRGEQVREHRFGDQLTDRRGKVGHLARIADQPAVVLVRELLGTKRRQSQLGDDRCATVLVEVGQMPRRPARARLIENQLLGHDLSSIGQIRGGTERLGHQREHRPGRDRRRE